MLSGLSFGTMPPGGQDSDCRRSPVVATQPQPENRRRMAIRDWPDSARPLPTLRVPALVVVGAEKPDQPPAAVQRLPAPIPGARCVEIPAAGDLRALAQFLESLC